MSHNVIKFTPEELTEITTLQDNFNKKMFQFGQFYLQRMELDSAFKDLATAEKQTQQEYILLQETESKLLKQLTTKYGEGQLNISDGEFIPKS